MTANHMQAFLSQRVAASALARRRFVPPSPPEPLSQSLNQRWRERPRCPASPVTPGRRDGVVHAIVGRAACPAVSRMPESSTHAFRTVCQPVPCRNLSATHCGAHHSAWSARHSSALKSSGPHDPERPGRSRVRQSQGRATARIEAADEGAPTGGPEGRAGTSDMASVPPHSFVTAERPKGAREDRPGAAWSREHLDDAQHLHARR